MIDQNERLRIYANLIAREGAKFGKCGRMCNECVFKLNSIANKDPDTVTDALDALAYYGEFGCHIAPGVYAGHTCAGFLYAKQYFENEFKTEVQQQGDTVVV